jgi:hypothetical protein
MVAALELYFDPPAERRIRKLWDALEDVGVPTLRDLTHRMHRPHLSLTGAERLDPAAIADALKDLTVAPALAIRLDYIGQFLGRVLWLGPVPSADLLAHHSQVHDRLSRAGIAGFEYYEPARWVPHTTLSMRVPLAKMNDAIRLCLDVLPISATVSAAAVADYARDEWTPL